MDEVVPVGLLSPRGHRRWWGGGRRRAAV